MFASCAMFATHQYDRQSTKWKMQWICIMTFLSWHGEHRLTRKLTASLHYFSVSGFAFGIHCMTRKTSVDRFVIVVSNKSSGSLRTSHNKSTNPLSISGRPPNVILLPNHYLYLNILQSLDLWFNSLFWLFHLWPRVIFVSLYVLLVFQGLSPGTLVSSPSPKTCTVWHI